MTALRARSRHWAASSASSSRTFIWSTSSRPAEASCARVASRYLRVPSLYTFQSRSHSGQFGEGFSGGVGAEDLPAAKFYSVLPAARLLSSEIGFVYRIFADQYVVICPTSP